MAFARLAHAPGTEDDGVLRKGPPFHGSRRSREIQEFRMRAVKWVVAKLQRDKTASFSGKGLVAKLQGDKSASQSSMELYDPMISGPLRIS